MIRDQAEGEFEISRGERLSLWQPPVLSVCSHQPLAGILPPPLFHSFQIQIETVKRSKAKRENTDLACGAGCNLTKIEITAQRKTLNCSLLPHLPLPSAIPPAVLKETQGQIEVSQMTFGTLLVESGLYGREKLKCLLQHQWVKHVIVGYPCWRLVSEFACVLCDFETPALSDIFHT